MSGFRKKYSVDIAREHAQCEVNFMSLFRLLGDAEQGKTLSFDVALPKRKIHYTLSFEVFERSKHTALVSISADQYVSKWLHDMDLEVAMYFDAGMAEVVHFNGQRRLQLHIGSHSNKHFAEDEKRQINAFLAEWLSHCLKFGLAAEINTQVTKKTFMTNV